MMFAALVERRVNLKVKTKQATVHIGYLPILQNVSPPHLSFFLVILPTLISSFHILSCLQSVWDTEYRDNAFSESNSLVNDRFLFNCCL